MLGLKNLITLFSEGSKIRLRASSSTPVSVTASMMYWPGVTPTCSFASFSSSVAFAVSIVSLPPSGFALAVMLLFGRKTWLGIGLGAFAINTQAFADVASMETIAVSVAVGIGIGIGSVAQPLLGTVLIRRFMKSGGLTDKVRNFFVFVSVVPVMCLVSSTVGTTSLLLGGFTTVEHISELWVTWWLGDGI